MQNNTIIIDHLRKDQKFIVGDNENKTFVIFLTGGNVHNGDVKIIIRGEKAQVRISGLIIGEGKQKIELFTLQDHVKPESVSDLFIKSVLFDEAKFNYRGLIKIEKNAQKSNAYQKNQNLLMSKNAWADSKPYLEILANDVRATHGATVGKIDPEQFFYLSSRGLDRKHATKLILEGFFNEVLEKIQNDKIREELGNRIIGKIERLLVNL